MALAAVVDVSGAAWAGAAAKAIAPRAATHSRDNRERRGRRKQFIMGQILTGTE
jgi:hypothetical protein